MKKFVLLILFMISMFLFTAQFATQFAIQPLSYQQISYPANVKYMKMGTKKMAYIDEGRGNAIVFIHGLSGDISHYKYLINKFKKTHRVVAMDLIGNGRSSKKNVKCSINYKAKTVILLLKKLGIKKAVIVGHSNGGIVTMNIAVKYPSFVKKIVLIAPNGLNKLTVKQAKYYKQFMPIYFSSLDNDRTAYLKSLVYKWNKKWNKFLAIYKRLVLSYDYKLVKQNALKTMYSAYDLETHLPDKYKNIKVPVLVLLGKYDNLIPGRIVTRHAFLRGIKTRIRNVKIIILKTGHMIQMENPRQTFNIIGGFVR